MENKKSVKTFRDGNNVIVLLPEEYCLKLDIKVGDKLKVTQKNGCIYLKKVNEQ